MRAVVMGSGSWGTATAKVLVDAGVDTTMWARRPALADAINASHTNPDYLQGIACASTNPTSPSIEGRCVGPGIDPTKTYNVVWGDEYPHLGIQFQQNR